MRRVPSPIRAAILAGVVLTMVLGLPAAAQQATRAQVKRQFDAAMKMYREGDYKEAAAAFDKVMKMSPSSEEAVILRESAGINILIEMLRDPKFAAMSRDILKKAQARGDDVRRDPATLKKLIEDLGSKDFAVRNRAINHCVSAGPFAVPYLLDHALSEEPASLVSRRSAALIAIQRMGPAGIPPLIFALRNAEDKDAGKIVDLIAMTPDARPVPDLLTVIEDMDRADALAKAARRTLRRTKAVAGEKLPSATEAFFSLASRYYYHDPLLIELVPERDRVMWKWSPKGETFAAMLQPVSVPVYAYPRLVAEELLLEGMKQKFPDPELLAMYAANNYMQLDDALRTKDTRAKPLARVHDINESLGGESLYLALQRALIDANVPLALRCIEGLRRVGDPRRPLVPNSLMDALAFEDKFVRAAAAETLMHVSPDASLGDPQEVVYILTTGLGVPARETVAVLTEATALRDQLMMTLRGWNMVGEAQKTPSGLAERVKRGLPPVNVVILDARIRGAKTPMLVRSLRQDPRSKSVAVVVLSTKEMADQLKKACGADAAAVLTVPVNTEALKSAVTSSMAAARTAEPIDDVRSNAALVRRILTTAGALAPLSAYPVHMLSNAAAGLLKGYPDDIRTLALRVIRSHPQPGLAETLYGMMIDPKQPVAIRREAGSAFLRCLSLNPTLEKDQVAAVRKLAAGKDATLRKQAIHALSIARLPSTDRQKHLLEDLGKIKTP